MEKWRLIIDPPHGGVENMAVDEALLGSASADNAFRPTLRVYGWSEPSLSLGYLQKSAPFSGLGLPLVRRITGGRALLHDIEFTYSITAGAGSALYSQGIIPCYSVISRAIVLTLQEFGIEAVFSRPRSSTAYRKSGACFASSARYEVLVGDKKIAGSAQRRVKGGLLQHGSIIFGLNRALWSSVFGDIIVQKTATVLEFCAVEPESFQQVFVEKLSRELQVSFIPGTLTGPEEELKRRLEREKYSQKEWNEQPALRKGTHRPGAFTAVGGI